MIGQALYAAQCGEEYPSVKALKGFGGRAVLEILAPYEGDAYRTVYTRRRVRSARFSEEVEERNRDSSKRYRARQTAARRCGAGLQRKTELR
jgi:hypothetical protein